MKEQDLIKESEIDKILAEPSHSAASIAGDVAKKGAAWLGKKAVGAMSKTGQQLGKNSGHNSLAVSTAGDKPTTKNPFAGHQADYDAIKREIQDLNFNRPVITKGTGKQKLDDLLKKLGILG